MNESDKLKEAVRLFQATGIKFVLVGGLAMMAHGADVLTQDVGLAYAVEFDLPPFYAPVVSLASARLPASAAHRAANSSGVL